MTDATQLIPSVFVTVAVALAALILTSASYTRQQFTEQIELQRRHSDSQFAQLREEIQQIRGEIRDIRGEVRALAERQAKVEGLLLAVHPPKLASPPSGAPGAESSASRTETARSTGNGSSPPAP